MKLCLIYNYAQHYRANIFKLIRETFDCDFVFGDSMADVKKLDYSILKGNVTETHTIRLFSGWYWQRGVVCQLFKNYDCYILLGETRALSTWLFCVLARFLKRRKKIYFWTHGWYGKETRLESLIKKIEFKLPNGGIFTYGDYARKLMIKEGFNGNKIFPIHNSLNYDQQMGIRKTLVHQKIFQDHFGNNNPNLFFVGRLTPVKQLDQVLDAMTICNKKGQYFNLTFIGDGTEMKKLKTKSEELELTDQVWFYGPCYDEQKLGLLIYNADLCVAPGNIGLTAMHSLVFGTPCITHNDFPYQMPEFEALEEGNTGTFFERDNVEDLAQKITDWFEKMGGNREVVRKLCMYKVDSEWNPYYQINVIKQGLGL